MHYHGYLWRDSEAARSREQAHGHIDSPRFRTSSAPPIKVCWWLRKPAALVRGTWADPKEAVDWMAERYAGFAPRLVEAEPYWAPGEERRTAAARDLAAGRDVSWSYRLLAGSGPSWPPCAARPTPGTPRPTAPCAAPSPHPAERPGAPRSAAPAPPAGDEQG
ncbi:hypothetical protein ACFPZ0_21180 [Streptomonospora nanhaiensis]|uniref:Uncharacterized protein n=1 Tax=Streptomonospora nanhaiensis TaxID=1323731 RepID=A0A853BRJ4_9ACTN|nr:hypothetical protein [Streptomonospora nanhaiensis]MBV2362865.1 hypothetical protein [Streptomonospora nanhaiensis]MBX9389390.1 hypothetical protein [Streptomonospora nanhaiensis]NYI97773.1 hypothetical protein [Streptomonospora nanhaiensis]